MGLTFLNGWLLGALSLVSIPIIIHLLQRRRHRLVQWGAMEFLQLSQRNRSRRLMIEQLILLLIRCLIIALVVLAVCRPVVRLGGMPIVGARGSVHAVILLDDSYSMGYRSGAGAETAFDRAVQRAIALVETGLKQGDAVSIVLCSDPPRALIRKPSLDLKAAAGMLRKSVAMTDAGTNFGAAARIALDVLGESSYANREVFLISDNQLAGWEGQKRDPTAWEALGKLARLIVMPAREGAAPNVAVEWVQAARGLATARSSARIQARIVNYGASAANGLLVTLEVDGEPKGATQRVDVAPGQATLVSFNQMFDKAGVRNCTVRLATDRLSADDTGYLALRVRQSVRVLVLNGKPNLDIPQNDAAFFLQLALSPPMVGPGAEPTPLDPQTITGTGFGTANVRDFDVVTLSDVASLADGDRRLLSEFVQNGGGVLMFLGDRVNAELYNRDLFEGSPSLLPARITGMNQAKTSLDPATLDHPALQRFRGAQDVEVSTAVFTRYFKLAPREGDKTVRVMARFANGDPALIEKQFGLGRIILSASTANTEWNSLPVKPVFLPLIHQLVAYLASGADGTRNGTVGQPVTRPLKISDAGQAVSITDPSGAKTNLRSVVDERGTLVTLERPARAGFYQLAIAGSAADSFAVNRDTAESNLQSADENALKRLLPISQWTWIGLNEDMFTALSRSRMGVELWRQLLFAALALMILETMLAQLFGRRS